MSYYEEKKKALLNIRSLAEQGMSLQDIKFYIFENYGFGDKMVEQYYNELLERGFIKLLSEIFECPKCGNLINILQIKSKKLKNPTKCSCGNTKGFKLIKKK